MSTLAREEIKALLKLPENEGLVITPLLNPEKQINQIGIDLRLGNQFIAFKAENIESFDIKEMSNNIEQINKIQKEFVVPYGTPYILHPQNMIIGATFEYISMPNRIEASIEGRSSWARVGLIIATATTIEPGFKGCITLELANISNIPIKLYPGVRIAQLIFRRTTSTCKYSDDKKYNCPIGPEFSKVHSDIDNQFFYKNK